MKGLLEKGEVGTGAKMFQESGKLASLVSLAKTAKCSHGYVTISAANAQEADNPYECRDRA